MSRHALITIARWATLSSCILLSGARATTTAIFPHYERYIAIDNVCAWPLLTKLPNGDLSVLIWPKPVHGTLPGAVEAWTSVDAGKSWQRTGVPVPNDPAMNRMNHAGGVTPDGKYLALVSGWDLNGEQEGAVLKPYGKTLAPVPSVSGDGGRTWKQFPAVPAPSGTGGFGLIPFGRILPLPDGELGAMFYSFGTFFFTSADGGATWKQRGALAELPATYKASKHNETCWLILRNGDLYAATRTAAWERLEAFRSKDMGRTWKSEGFITFAGQAPADLTQLPDDRVLLTYTIRNPGQWGVGARFADAAAANWSEPVRIVDLDGPGTGRDVGYPSSVVLADNVIVTAYYSRAITTHHRYHMGVVRWKPPLPKVKASTEKKSDE